MTNCSTQHNLHNDLRPPGCDGKSLILCVTPSNSTGGVNSIFSKTKAAVTAYCIRTAGYFAAYGRLDIQESICTHRFLAEGAGGFLGFIDRT